MASGIYTQFKADMPNKVIDWEADTIKVALMENDYTFVATHTTLADVTSAGTQCTSTNYTAGGSVLVSPTVTEGVTTKLDGTDLTWTAVTLTARFAIIYNSSVSDNLICCLDFGADKVATIGEFKIQWDSDGILTIA